MIGPAGFMQAPKVIPPNRTPPDDKEGWKLTGQYTKKQLLHMKLPVPKKGETLNKTFEENAQGFYHRFEIALRYTDLKGTYGDRLYEYWYRNIEFRD